MNTTTRTSVIIIGTATTFAAAEINTTWGFSDLAASYNGAGSLTIEAIMLSDDQGTSGMLLVSWAPLQVTGGDQ